MRHRKSGIERGYAGTLNLRQARSMPEVGGLPRLWIIDCLEHVVRRGGSRRSTVVYAMRRR